LVHTKTLSRTGSFTVALGEAGAHFIKIYSAQSYEHTDATYELGVSPK
jgi:hypothetical protein